MVDFGMKLIKVLCATASIERSGSSTFEEKIGRVLPGLEAHLIAIGGDPTTMVVGID